MQQLDPNPPVAWAACAHTCYILARWYLGKEILSSQCLACQLKLLICTKEYWYLERDNCNRLPNRKLEKRLPEFETASFLHVDNFRIVPLRLLQFWLDYIRGNMKSASMNLRNKHFNSTHLVFTFCRTVSHRSLAWTRSSAFLAGALTFARTGHLVNVWLLIR